MRIIKINVCLETGTVGSDRREVLDVEVEDNANEKEEEQACEEAANQWGWSIVELGWSRV